MAATSVLRVRHRLAELAEAHDVPGASVSVFADGEVVDAAVGTVNLRTGVEVRPDSPFMIQSITKVWTATLVMQLVDEDLVALDEPITRYLPGFRTADRPASAGITVRHLLTHTGGFEGDLWAATTTDDDALKLFVDEHVSRATQYLEPGRAYSYCSAGLGVLGRLVEALRGTTYAVALRRYLTDPLGVDEVAFDAGEAMGFRTAIGHVRPGPGEPLRTLPTWAVLPLSNPAAGNQLAMPARGLIEFAQMHLADGRAPRGARLLSAESARMMRTPQVAVPATFGGPVDQGLGWRLTAAGRVAEHGGDAPGCAAMLRLVPDRQVAVAVLGNGGDMTGLVSTLCDELLSELAGVAPRVLGSVPHQTAVDDPDRYCGRYELRNRVAEVSTDDQRRLWLTQEERNEAAWMSMLAGIDSRPETFELRRVEGGRFARLDREGEMAGVVEFIDTDSMGRARFLHDGRAAPRVD
ncbi:serine hydrolase domain-containing protein [Nocardioides endophyticus]|uniref:Serine hydrolase domain-containing protein n=1 Tax=Nocardioides endophyticus TaxID=1353775 RepID=A0ABP8YTX8_9ACTN